MINRAADSDKIVKNIFWFLISFTIFLLLAHFTLRLYAHFNPLDYPITLFRRFNLDAEGNIPTWFSTIQLFSISALTFFIYNALQKKKITGFELNFWLIFSFFYLFLSADEAGQIHEIIDQQIGIKWVYFYAPLAALFFGMVFFHFLGEKKFHRKDKNLMIAGLIIFATGSLAIEFADYYFDPGRFIEQIEILFEEGMEMFGSSLIIIGTLKIAAANCKLEEE